MHNTGISKGFGWTRAAGLALLVAGFVACGSEDGDRRTANGGGSGTGTGATGNVPGGGGTGTGPIIPTNPQSNDDRDVPVRERVCDESGENCTCLRLALLGTLDSAADDKDTQPFVDWLNGNSDGTATVTMVTTKPTLDETWLAQYDILLVANVNTWAFSDAEKAAVETWVRETGGGIVALTGFTSDTTEPAATSQLLSFAGVQYSAPETAPDRNGEAAGSPVYYKGGSTDLKKCLHWTESVGSPQITAPVKFQPQADALEALTFSLDYVGAYYGWTVSGPGTVVANDPVSGGAIAMAHEVDGTGRIFAFGDEWVIFGDQWEALGQPHDPTAAEHNICWQPPSGDEPAFFHSIETLYQVKQFWYNAINWVAPPNECNFVVQDDNVIIR